MSGRHVDLTPRALRRGFTLLEMMVAIAIAAFVVAGLYGLFTVQSRQFLYQDLQMEMHQNLRFGTDVLSRSLRLAGYNTNGYVSGVAEEIYDEGELMPAILGWDANGANNTDAVTVVYGDPSTVISTDPDVRSSCGTTTLYFNTDDEDTVTRLQQYISGDLVLCHDYAAIPNTETYMWEATSDGGATDGTIDVNDNTGGSYTHYENYCSSDENLTPIMRCSKAQVLTFYVDDTDDGTGPGTEDHPVLMMDMNYNWPQDDDVPLVDNVEDLQLEYCVIDPTGATDCNDPMRWQDSFTADEADQVWAVRIHLLVRSSRPDIRGVYKSTRPDIANHSGSSDEDNYYRQVLTTEVTVRNIRML